MGATFTLKGSGSGAVKAVQDLQKALGEVDKAADGAAKSNAQLERQAKRVAEQAEPQRRYNRQLQELAVLVDKGKISLQDAEKVAQRYGGQLERAGESGDRAFGASALNKLTAYVGGIVSVTGFVSALSSAFRDVEQNAQAAADNVVNALGSIGELQQLGPEASKRGAATARRLVQLGVVRDTTQAVDIATNLENAGFSASEINLLVETVAAKRLVSADNLTQVGTALKKFQTATGETDLQSVLDKSLYVSTIPGVATGLTATVNETLKFADFFKQFGTNQTLAAFAGVEAISPSAENASEALKSFGAQVKKRGLASGDLFGTLANVQSQISGSTTAFDVLGEQNAVIGFERLLQQRDAIRQYAGQIASAGGTAQANAGLLNDDPVYRAANLQALSQGRLAASREENLSRRESLLASIRNDTRRLQGDGASAYLRDLFGYAISDLIGSEDTAIRSAYVRETTRLAQGQSPELSQETFNEIRDYLREIATATTATANGTRKKAATRQSDP